MKKNSKTIPESIKCAGMTNGYNIEELLTAERHTLPYWVKFITIFLVRVIIVSGLFYFYELGGLLQHNSGAYTVALFLELSYEVLRNYWWVFTIDIVVALLFYPCYRYNPKQITVAQYFEEDIWKRCSRRQINYILWALIIPIAIIFGCAIIFS